MPAARPEAPGGYLPAVCLNGDAHGTCGPRARPRKSRVLWQTGGTDAYRIDPSYRLAGHWCYCCRAAQLLQRLARELRARGDHRGDHSGGPAELRRRESQGLLPCPAAESVSPLAFTLTATLSDRRPARPGRRSVCTSRL